MNKNGIDQLLEGTKKVRFVVALPEPMLQELDALVADLKRREKPVSRTRLVEIAVRGLLIEAADRGAK